MACPAVQARKRGGRMRRGTSAPLTKDMCPLAIEPLPFPAIMTSGTNLNVHLNV